MTETALDMRGALLVLWRRKAVLLSVLLIGLCVAAIFMAAVKPTYTAKALVLIGASSDQGGSENSQGEGQFQDLDMAFILSEIEVIKSRELAHKVVQRLNLATDPEFNSRFHYGGARGANSNASNDFKKLSVYGAALETLPAEAVDREIGEVVSRFLSRLKLRSVRGSYAVEIGVESEDPSKAALIANMIADVYIQQRFGGRSSEKGELAGWFDERFAHLQGRLQTATRAVAEYKGQNHLVEDKQRAARAERTAELRSQIVEGQAELAKNRALLSRVKASGGGNSSLIKTLERQESLLEGEFSDLSSRYGPKHPRIVKLQSELSDLRVKIRDAKGGETLKAGQSAEKAVQDSQARLVALQQKLSGLQAQGGNDEAALDELRELERETVEAQLVLETFLDTYKRFDERDVLAEARGRVLSYAIAPRDPSYPNKPVLFIISALVSAFLGLLIAAFLETLDTSFRSASAIEKALSYPCFALIPSVESQSQRELGDYIVSKPSSVLAESVRALRIVLNLRGRREGRRPRVVTITSSLEGEGKTALSVWLGRLAAKSGEKVILIDADLRRPDIHRCVGRSNDVTLVDYLTGQKELAQVIQKDDPSGLHMIYGRSVPNSALDLLSASKMSKLVASLAQVYDLVILDSPACLGVSDSRVLAAMSDQTLYAVAWASTKREVVAGGVKQFTDIHYDDLAFVLTHVDMRRNKI